MQRRSCITRTGIFGFSLLMVLSLWGKFKHKFLVCEGQLMKILGFIFSGDQEKNYVEFFDARILQV